jgi:AMP deaminase
MTSMHTGATTVNQADHRHFSTLPQGAMAGTSRSSLIPIEQAWLYPSTSATDLQTDSVTHPASPTRTKHEQGFERPRRSSSMAMNPGSTAPPQPTGAGVGAMMSESQASPVPGAEEQLSLARSTSSTGLMLDDIEPKIFPGVVSRRRRSSMRSSAAEDGESMAGPMHTTVGHPGHSGFRRGDGGEVVMEQDSDDD